MDENVEYREVPGFSGYRVGSDGSVWSCLRGCTWRRLRHRQSTSKNTRRCKKGTYISAMLSRDSVQHNRLVHVLVLEAFVGPRPEGQEARHLDGDPTNNRLNNLAWGTRSENFDDMRRHGTMPVGADKPNAKLDDAAVVAILALHERGVTVLHMALIFSTSPASIYQVLDGRRWKSSLAALRELWQSKEKESDSNEPAHTRPVDVEEVGQVSPPDKPTWRTCWCANPQRHERLPPRRPREGGR